MSLIAVAVSVAVIAVVAVAAVVEVSRELLEPRRLWEELVVGSGHAA